MKIRVHLITGEIVESVEDKNPVSQEFITTFDEAMSQIVPSDPDTGWQLSLDLPNNGKAFFPGLSILYVERV